MPSLGKKKKKRKIKIKVNKIMQRA